MFFLSLDQKWVLRILFSILFLFDLFHGVMVYGRSFSVLSPHSPTENFSRGYSEKQQLESIENYVDLTPK
ncbi:hypothetical protein AT240_05630 [Bartonella henselae]|nr:hypothetical protein AT240_05630 [Bartonella henselae]